MIQDSRFMLPFVGTFHSLGARILRKEAHNLGRTQNYTIYDSDDSLQAIKRAMKNLDISVKDMGPTLFRYLISKIKSDLVEPAEVAEGEKLRLLHAVYDEYEAELARSNAFDFDDLIEKPVRLWQEHSTLLKKYQTAFQYVLVDEFQDVNTAQYEFVRLLAREHKNINVVGDDAQSIYKFRGAEFRHFLNFEKDWPETRVVFLEENYRSTSPILTAANAVIAKNKMQKPKNLWTKKEGGAPVAVVEHEDEVAEAEWMASEIKNLKLKIENYSTAVLYRTNAQSRAIEQALIERDIPYQIFGSIRFYERKEVKDMVSCLRYAANPKDAVSLERMEKSFYVKPFRELRAELPQKASELSPYELIAYAIHTTNYFEYLKKNYPNAEERVENLNELMGFAEQYSNLNEFLEKVTLLQSSDNENSRAVNQELGIRNKELGKVGGKETTIHNSQFTVPNPVALMTVHIAKGLEFDKVFVAGCNEGLLPHQMSYKTPEEIEEERRLMYVAMTRAKSELALSFYHIGSRFLYEIPPELIEFSAKNSSIRNGKSELIDDEERYISFD